MTLYVSKPKAPTSTQNYNFAVLATLRRIEKKLDTYIFGKSIKEKNPKDFIPGTGWVKKN